MTLTSVTNNAPCNWVKSLQISSVRFVGCEPPFSVIITVIIMIFRFRVLLRLELNVRGEGCGQDLGLTLRLVSATEQMCAIVIFVGGKR